LAFPEGESQARPDFFFMKRLPNGRFPIVYLTAVT